MQHTARRFACLIDLWKPLLQFTYFTNTRRETDLPHDSSNYWLLNCRSE